MPPGNAQHGAGVAQRQAHHQQQLGNGQHGVGSGEHGASADVLNAAGLGNPAVQQSLHNGYHQRRKRRNPGINQHNLFGVVAALQPVGGFFL